MKAIITGILAVAFIISYSMYLYTMSAHLCSLHVMKLWNYYTIAGMVFSIWVLEKWRIQTELQESIIIGSKFLLLLIFADIILTNHGLIKDPYSNLIIFMVGSGLAITLLLYQLIKTYGWLWLILAMILGVMYFYFLLGWLVPLTLK